MSYNYYLNNIYVETSMWICVVPKPELKYPKLVNRYLLTVPHVYSDSHSAERT